jgi:hypothetical protein
MGTGKGRLRVLSMGMMPGRRHPRVAGVQHEVAKVQTFAEWPEGIVAGYHRDERRKPFGEDEVVR